VPTHIKDEDSNTIGLFSRMIKGLMLKPLLTGQLHLI